MSTINVNEFSSDFIVEGTVVTYANQLYYVTKVNPKNFKVIDEHGQHWNLRRTSHVKRAADQDAWTGEKPNPYKNYMKAVESGLTLGSTVRFTSATNARKWPGVYVVTGVTGDKFRVAKLGGDAGKYVRGLSADHIKAVTGSFNEEN